MRGYVVPTPSTYNSDDQKWYRDAFTECREPDQVKLWYYAGDMDEAFLSGDSCDPLSNYYARVIAWLATARLERPFCQCGNLITLAEHLREDLSHQGEVSHLIDFELLGSPFGTRRGELMAWKSVSKLGRRQLDVGVI
jgi:hypothetical protein